MFSNHRRYYNRPWLNFVFVLLLIFMLTACTSGKKSPAATEPELAEESTPLPQEEPVEEIPEPELPGAFLVVIENHPDARPQYGLEQADVVYEMDAVYGISRFLAVFYHHAPEQIGPVRSARQYLVDIARAYQGPFVHAGGNVDSLQSLQQLRRQEGFPDMDEIRGAGEYFWRGKDRRAPHNLYTSSEKILQAVQDRGWPLEPPPPLQFGTMPGGASVDRLTIEFRGGGAGKNLVAYEYREGKYWRSINGSPHNTPDGSQLTADNLVTIHTTSKLIHPSDPSLDIQVIGEGKAEFFSQGKYWEGTWRRSDVREPFQFLVEGQPMQFTRGNLWVEIITPPHVLEFMNTQETDEETGEMES